MTKLQRIRNLTDELNRLLAEVEPQYCERFNPAPRDVIRAWGVTAIAECVLEKHDAEPVEQTNG